MPILNFKKEFAELVATGKKRQTIRATRKKPITVGDRLYLYTGLRTKGARNIVSPAIADTHLARINGEMETVFDDYTVCKEVHDIEMDYEKVRNRKDLLLVIKIDSILQDSKQMKDVAKADGFFDLDEMFYWFEKTHGLPFKGQIIKW